MRTTEAWWAPKFNMTDVLMKRGDLHTNIYTRRMRECYVKIKAETAIT